MKKEKFLLFLWLVAGSVLVQAQTFRFDFSTGKKTEKGFTKVTSESVYSDEKGYGYDLQPAWDGKGNAPFFFSVEVPDGNYRVTVTLGSRKSAGMTTVRGESRRLFLENIPTRKGELRTESFTINKRNVGEIPGIFRLLADLEVPRACFYHLVYSGRGSELIKEDLDHAETRQVLDLIMDETRALFDAGKPKEILTVDNHADGPYVWMRMKREDPKRAEEIFELLQYNEGNNSGRGIGCISWDGKVHADQFWRNHTFGNVLERPFSEIWDDPNIELLHKMKNKKAYVKGRCASCRFLNICGGNFRSRAKAYYGDEWAQDPACYLTDEEIGL